MVICLYLQKQIFIMTLKIGHLNRYRIQIKNQTGIMVGPQPQSRLRPWGELIEVRLLLLLIRFLKMRLIEIIGVKNIKLIVVFS
jgi:hypothetical protein